jgi:hypothetical protein
MTDFGRKQLLNNEFLLTAIRQIADIRRNAGNGSKRKGLSDICPHE